MWIFCLMRVESSLVGSVRTDILRMSPSSNYRGSSFIINSSILMGAFTFVAFVQPLSICREFSFLLRAITIYSNSWFVQNVCRLFAQMYTSLRMFYGFCVHFCTDFAYLYGFCVRFCTDFAHVMLVLRTYKAYLCASCATFAYVYGFLCALIGFCVRTWNFFVRC